MAAGDAWDACAWDAARVGPHRQFIFISTPAIHIEAGEGAAVHTYLRGAYLCVVASSSCGSRGGAEEHSACAVDSRWPCSLAFAAVRRSSIAAGVQIAPLGSTQT